VPRWPLPPCLGALAQVAPPLRPLAPPCAPLQPFTVPQNPCAPSRTLAPPYRHTGLDCVTLEQAIGEGRAAELAPAELEAAEAVLEKARAAEKVKCEKDLREKMKATLTLTLALTLTLTCGLLCPWPNFHAHKSFPWPPLNSFPFPSPRTVRALTAPM
jgi:hypothetical protein